MSQISREALREFAEEWSELLQEDVASSDYYFNSYSHLSIHEEMLKDETRTNSYAKAILQNKHLFVGKTVIDVGSGSGILSLFAAKAGAKHVYAIECSEIVHVAEKIAEVNGFSDKITFYKAKAEDVELPVESVDIIVSEWMGYMLLYESMLDTVLHIRDKWLKKAGGLIFPDRATMHVAAIEDGEYKKEKIGFWDFVYGFDFSCVKRAVMEEPLVDYVSANALVTNSVQILDLNLYTCTSADLDFVTPFRLTVTRKDFMHALVIWFDVGFESCHTPVRFSTGPNSRATHWKQTVLYLEDEIVAEKGDTLDAVIAIRKNQRNFRDIDIKLRYHFNGLVPASRTQFYRLR